MATNHYSTNDKSSIPGLELAPPPDGTPTTLSYLNNSPSFVENSVKKNSISFPSPITNLHIAGPGFDIPPPSSSLKKISPSLDFDEENDIDDEVDDIDDDDNDDDDIDDDDDDENIVDGWEEIEEKPRDVYTCGSGGGSGADAAPSNHHENQSGGGGGELSSFQKGKNKGILKKTNNVNTKKKNFEQGIEEEVPKKKSRNENEKKNILCITGEEEKEGEITKREKKKMRAVKQNNNNNNNNRKKKRATNKQNQFQLNAFATAAAFGDGENLNCSVCSQRLRVIRAILKAFDLTL